MGRVVEEVAAEALHRQALLGPQDLRDLQVHQVRQARLALQVRVEQQVVDRGTLDQPGLSFLILDHAYQLLNPTVPLHQLGPRTEEVVIMVAEPRRRTAQEVVRQPELSLSPFSVEWLALRSSSQVFGFTERTHTRTTIHTASTTPPTPPSRTAKIQRCQ